MDGANNKYLIVIAGPTAIGKTAMAIKIAQYFNCEILSADSRQFYKEMTIGTAVPTPEELDAVTHHFIQNKSILENYTVGDYEREAIELLDNLFLKNNFAVLVGGSGLYINAVLKGFDDFPDIDISVRNELIQKHEAEGIAYLQQELKRKDPEQYGRMDTENPQRLMRALEVCIGTGLPYSSFLNQKKNTRNFIPVVIGLEAERPVLYNRINTRVDIMVAEGLLDEARGLYNFKDNNALQTVGYRELFASFDGEYNIDFAIEEIKKNTRRFAKRQMTWFKKDTATTWFDYATPPHKIINYIKSRIHACSP